MEQSTQEVRVTFEPPVDGTESSFDVDFETAMEMIHILAMSRWESTAPPPGKVGLHGGIELENSQQARLQYLLKGIGVGDPERTYSRLAVETRNHRTMDSKITTERPAHGLPLLGRWHLDCCLNLRQKLEIVGALWHLGYSQFFIEIAKRFLAGQPISKIEADRIPSA
jgi:hypothetical protein